MSGEVNVIPTLREIRGGASPSKFGGGQSRDIFRGGPVKKITLYKVHLEGENITRDEVVKAILNLGGENYGSGNRVLILSETCHYSNTLLVYICMYYTLNN